MAHGNLKAFKESMAKNDIAALNWLNRLEELALCSFKWENVPPSVDIRYLELTLCEKGSVVWFRDEVTGELLALTAVNLGRFDVYGNPMYTTATGYNGYTKQVDYSNSVVMWNNYERTPSFLILANYARQLADIERTIEVNLNGQKSPKIIQCTKDQYLSLKNIELKSDGNQRYIYVDNELNPSTLQVIDMTVPFTSDKLFNIKNKIWAEALGYLGIPANSIEKAERINLLELELSNASTDAQRYTKLISRQKAVEAINDRFGTDIKVSFRFTGTEGREQNGGVYSLSEGDTDELPPSKSGE